MIPPPAASSIPRDLGTYLPTQVLYIKLYNHNVRAESIFNVHRTRTML
jgi:hypothetical protein